VSSTNRFATLLREAMTGSFAGSQADLDAFLTLATSAISAKCGTRNGVKSLSFRSVSSTLWVHDPVGAAWIHQSGTALADGGFDVASDASGNAFVAAKIGAPVLTKYDSGGDVLWASNALAGEASAVGDAVDNAGNPIVVGETDSGDVYVTKFDTNGVTLWTSVVASAGADKSFDVATDAADDVYVAGEAAGTLAGETGSGPLFVVKYDSSGTVQWTHRSEGESGGHSIAVDPAGDVYLTGGTDQTLTGSLDANAGGGDILVRKIDGAGNDVWLHELGGVDDEYGTAIAVDPAGGVDVAGRPRSACPVSTRRGSRNTTRPATSRGCGSSATSRRTRTRSQSTRRARCT
jgi:hypothetical protein